jgi:thioredoxin-like negative regulator of GroEL
MSATQTVPPRRRARDRRPQAVAALVIGLFVVGQLIAWAFRTEQSGWSDVSEPVEKRFPRKEGVDDLLRPPPPAVTAAVDPAVDPAAHQQQARRQEIDLRFRQGAAMLHAKRYHEAATAFNRVLELAPELAEAHVNMGFALVGLERYDEALAFFARASDLRPMQTNAYYGMAVAYERLGELRLAVETMEAYLHLEKEDAYYRRLALGAVWEWRAALAPADGDATETARIIPEHAEGALSQGEGGTQPAPGENNATGTATTPEVGQSRAELDPKRPGS